MYHNAEITIGIYFQTLLFYLNATLMKRVLKSKDIRAARSTPIGEYEYEYNICSKIYYLLCMQIFYHIIQGVIL